MRNTSFIIDKKNNLISNLNSDTSRKCALLVDFDINLNSPWSFIDGLNSETNEKWVIFGKTSNKDHGSFGKNLLRYIKYFSFSFEMLRKREHFKVLLAWQQFYGIIIAWIAHLFRLQNMPDIFVMTFIYKKKNGFFGVLYHRFIKFALCSKYVKSVFVCSKSEQLYYSNLFNQNSNFFVPVTLGIEDIADRYAIEDGVYYVSAGRSNRDYAFLEENWPYSYKLAIISDSVEKEVRNDINYEMNCYGNEYLEKVARCHAVIVPLKDNKISSGQLVVLQALMFGKPIIVTKNDTITEYIEDGRCGFIIEKNKESLNRALKLIDENYDSLSNFARKDFEDRFSLLAFGKNIGRIINDELQGSKG